MYIAYSSRDGIRLRACPWKRDHFPWDCGYRYRGITVSLISLCALSGAFCRYTITSVAGLPLTLAAVLAMTISIILIYSFRMYLPPAGALTLLAMLIPRAALAIYPVSVFAGVSIFMLISGWMFRSRAYGSYFSWKISIDSPAFPLTKATRMFIFASVSNT